METVFDHNPTKEELLLLGIRGGEAEYKKRLGPDSAYADIYSLYTLRKDDKTADEYLNKIKNESYRFCVSYEDLVSPE